MKIILSVTAGPFEGQQFTFESHDTFLVGRVSDAHLQFSFNDPFFSRRHFVLEVNPPRCRVRDLKSRNGTFVNDAKVSVADLKDGDLIRAGHTVFKVSVEITPDEQPTQELQKLDEFGQQAKPDDHPTIVPGQCIAKAGPARPAIPGYDVEDEIGRGSTGIVYRAVRIADRMTFAIKTIIPAVAITAKYVDTFMREAKILEQLSHQHIVGFHEMGQAGEVLFLVMEFVDGPDVARVLRRKGPMEIRTAARMTCQMLSGLGWAHAQGFVHRDIKPANLVIKREGEKKYVKITDFGVARAYDSAKFSGLTLQDDLGGTVAYMAPEQVTHYRDVKPAADQFSAAATLYKMLTNQDIHDLPADIEQQLIHITTEKPVPIRERRSDIPGALARVIDRALNREPGDRYPDVGALRAELLKWAS